MIRLRRYRVFLIIAAVALFLLYRMTQEVDWDGLPTGLDFSSEFRSKPEAQNEDQRAKTGQSADKHGAPQKRPQDQQKPLRVSDGEEEGVIRLPELKEPHAGGDDVDYTLPTATTSKTTTKPTSVDESQEKIGGKTTEAPILKIPDRKTPHQTWDEQAEKEREFLRQQQMSETASSTTSTTSTSIPHWRKPTEAFPIASDSLIALPTGKPKTIPRIQHVFKKESSEARKKREGRLAKVKAEIERAWGGYKSYAWMHDELSPVTNLYRNPFCGWAATLVDSLDTLWIAGLKDEFEEAVKAVGDIDFTTSTRSDIPVFETTIRYLGGLLGAYDVSGGHEGGHKILLEKAVELAEILMGVFDTPNRMPILYYHWNPEYRLGPQRAGTSLGVAELGSLLMEFTRLAQLTKENKYYDAVARITDAFEEWQTRPNGTTIPGIFPEQVDATGCNRTAAMAAEMLFNEQEAAKAQSVLTPPREDTTREDAVPAESPIDSESAPGSMPGPTLAHSKRPNSMGSDRVPTLNRRQPLPVDANSGDDALTIKTGVAAIQKVFTAPQIKSAPDLYQHMMVEKVTAEPYTIPELETNVCFPKGLESGNGGWGRESYSMGGSQDSTYEYFPKQYLLLGGLESKYRDIHLKVVAAVKKWLLYRPMVPDERNILFSAKLTTAGKPEIDAIAQFEVTHLTCFLGGMFAMGGKIFEDAVDLEIGKRLTDGCVWAYESMPTGIMPEGAEVVPCAEINNCRWNETIWHRYLDPSWNTRDLQIEDYERRKKEAEEQAAKARLESLRRPTPTGREEADRKEAAEDDSTIEQLRKRGIGPKPEVEPARETLETSSNDNSPPTKTTKTFDLEDTVPMRVKGGHRRVGKPVRNGQTPLKSDEDSSTTDPLRPMSHKEYVAGRIESEKIPGGFVSIQSKSYILRPEAIESVWYMYRITGDKTWQEKGWKMFESIIAMTQTQSGHSAIQDVLNPQSDKSNEMESFWLAETLKYFYLLYSTPDVISLDEWVLNTEAHPFRRPSSSSS